MKAVAAFCLSLVFFILGAARAGAAPALVYSTWLGGEGGDGIRDVAVDSAGNAIVLGESNSLDGSDGYFLAKLSPMGELIFLRPLELPSSPDEVYRVLSAVALDPAGYIHIAGMVSFETCEGPYSCTEDFHHEGFVAKLGPEGTGLFYDTTFSEGYDTRVHDLAVDALGRAHVRSTSYWPRKYGEPLSYGVSFSPAGSLQGYFGYPPDVISYVNAIALGPSGDLFAVGWQYPDYPSYAIYLQRTDASSGAVVETLLDDSGTIELVDVAGAPGGGAVVVGEIRNGGGSYIAGFDLQGEEVFSRVLNLGAVVISDVAVTSSGEILLAGYTAWRADSLSDAFVLRLDGRTGQVLSSIPLSGSGFDYAYSLAVGPGGHAYVVGSTSSPDFPTVNSLQPFKGRSDGFIARISQNLPPDCSRSTSSPSVIWPPNGKMVPVSILGVTDPEGDAVALKVTGISQDEPGAAFSGLGSSLAQVKAERDGKGDGRVYHIEFEATDPSGASCTGQVTVCVPRDQGRDKGSCVDSSAQLPSSR